ncbi:DUF4345 family protein [Mesorhizobium sp. VNQ89]|uniref:AGROH133_08824 family phage infection protein n=1 Tax=Mesorhizobium quangtriensis TaxID=3157709 RepID=UPI0032B831A9
MGFAFSWPVTQGEWLAWISAVVTVLLGVFLLFAPGTAFRLLRLPAKPERPEAYAVARANMAGFYLGAGLSALLLAQPLLYMALGFCWLFTAFGRIVSMMSDQANRLSNWLWLVIDVTLAAMALAFSFGLVA